MRTVASINRSCPKANKNNVLPENEFTKWLCHCCYIGNIHSAQHTRLQTRPFEFIAKMKICGLSTNCIFLSCWITTNRHCNFFFFFNQDLDPAQCLSTWLSHGTRPTLRSQKTCLVFFFAISHPLDFSAEAAVSGGGRLQRKRWTVCSLGSQGSETIVKR